MKILIIMQWCRPEPDFKCIPIAKALQARGHEVEVLTGFPNYPGGKVYLGYRIRWIQRETIDGVPVIRVPLFPSHDRSSIKRALNYLSFACSASLIGPFVTRKPDVVYVYNPMGLPALVFKVIKRAPFVYDIQDLWPDSLAASGMMRLGRFPLAMLNRFFSLVYRSSAKIIVLSPGFKRALEKRGVPADKVEVIYNWCNEDAIPSSSAGILRDGETLEIVYAGNMGRPQALDCVIEAARRLESERPRIRFTFIGGGTQVESLRARSDGLGNVRFVAQVSQDEAGRRLQQADVLLVHLKNDPLFAITIPSKIQFYLAMGKPILAGLAGDAAALVQRSGAGFVFQPEDVDSLVERITQLDTMASAELHAKGDQGRRFYREHLSLEIAAARFESILACALSPSRTTRL
jgi:glycosyltransferase involved in cell wall biosynthesis